MENGSSVVTRVAELERQVSTLAFAVTNLTAIAGALNAVVGRLADDTAFEDKLDIDIYRRHAEELDADVQRVLKAMNAEWPPETGAS